MKNKEFKILSFDKTIILNSIQRDNIEKIRIWKNENKNSFFYKKDISQPEQLAWFKKYIKTADDCIFIIKYLTETVGCIGFRKIENDIDIYNVMLGENKYKSSGIMSKSLKLLCSYLISIYGCSISAKVIKDNAALNWYLKNNFSISIEEQDYFLITLNNKFEKVQYILEG